MNQAKMTVNDQYRVNFYSLALPYDIRRQGDGIEGPFFVTLVQKKVEDYNGRKSNILVRLPDKIWNPLNVLIQERLKVGDPSYQQSFPRVQKIAARHIVEPRGDYETREKEKAEREAREAAARQAAFEKEAVGISPAQVGVIIKDARKKVGQNLQETKLELGRLHTAVEKTLAEIEKTTTSDNKFDKAIYEKYGNMPRPKVGDTYPALHSDFNRIDPPIYREATRAITAIREYEAAIARYHELIDPPEV